MKAPQACYDQYKDIYKDTIYTCKKEAIAAYLGEFVKSVDNHVKYICMKFLKYIRLVCGLFFVKAERHAEMKKSISYKVDVCVNIDWCIVQCQCECSAGTGQYTLCKHVSTMLFGLQMCSECGDIVTEETWTQNLQTFHHTKRYKGSHIQAKDVPLANQDLNVILNSDQDFQNAAGQQDIYRNVWLNHLNLNYFSVSQLFSYDNWVTINNDHDNSQDPPSDNWLQNMNITARTDDKIIRTERQTSEQSSNRLWDSEHEKRINFSNFGKTVKQLRKMIWTKLENFLQNLAFQYFTCLMLWICCFAGISRTNLVFKQNGMVFLCLKYILIWLHLLMQSLITADSWNVHN